MLLTLIAFMIAPPMSSQQVGGSGGGYWGVARTIVTPSSGPPEYYGLGIATGGDVDGDGIGDLGVTSFYLPTSGYAEPKIHFYSGSALQAVAGSYSPFFTFRTLPWGEGFPANSPVIDNTQLCDLTGDGQAELLAAGFSDIPGQYGSMVLSWNENYGLYGYWKAKPAPYYPPNLLYSPAPGSFESLGDLTGDGHPDVLSFLPEFGYTPGYTNPTLYGVVAILDGRTGVVVQQVSGTDSSHILDAGPAGDLNGDGSGDFFLLRGDAVLGNGAGYPFRYELWSYDEISDLQLRSQINEIDLAALLSVSYAEIFSGVHWNLTAAAPYPNGSPKVALMTSIIGSGTNLLRFAIEPTTFALSLDRRVENLAAQPIVSSHIGDLDGDGFGEVAIPGSSNILPNPIISLERDEVLDWIPSGATFGSSGVAWGGLDGHALRPLGDLLSETTGEDLGEFVAGVSTTHVSATNSVFIYQFQPAIRVKTTGGASATTVSSVNPTNLLVDLNFLGRFESSGTSYTYQILASLAGPGPTVVDGVPIPLGQDQYFNLSLAGSPPFQNMGGALPGAATITDFPITIPALPNQAGNTLRLAAILKTTAGTPQVVVSSVSWPLFVQ